MIGRRVARLAIQIGLKRCAMQKRKSRERAISRKSRIAFSLRPRMSLEPYSRNSTSSEAQRAATSGSERPVRNTVVTLYGVPANRLAY